MFLLRSRYPQPTGPTLTLTAPAPDDRQQRRARQLGMCQRLAELGMELVEAAHREALRECQPPAERRRSSIAGLPDLSGYTTPPAFRSDTFGQLFTLLSRCVRQAILLESRIEAGLTGHPSPSPAFAERAAGREPASSPPPPRGASDHTRIAHERLDDDLAADAGRSAPAILAGICADFQAVIDAHHLPGPASPTPEPHAAPAASPSRTPLREPSNPRPLTALERSAQCARPAQPHATPPPARPPRTA